MSADRQAPFEPGVGLCSVCRHARRIESGRGSTFWLCERSFVDPRYPKYPPLPVRACAGYEVQAGGPLPNGDVGSSQDGGVSDI